jgi:hypothetical protein
MDLSLRHHRATFTTDNTYDALYKQANLSGATTHSYALGRRRRNKTLARLSSSTSTEESEDTSSTFSSSANEKLLLLG